MSDQIHNETGPYNQRGHAILGVCIACGVLETVAVALRFLARRKLGAKWRIDDWLILVALIPNYAMAIVFGFAVGEGKTGMHKTALSEHQLETFLKTVYASMITYAATVTLVRISVLLLLHRIFEIFYIRVIVGILSGLCLAWGISIIFVNVFLCIPVSDAFNPAVAMSIGGRCIDLQAMLYGTLGSAVILDVAILILPLHQVWRSQLPNRQKYEITAIFGLGGLACVASVMRIVAVGEVRRADLVYTGVEGYMWSQIEPSAAILCACCATYRPLFRDMRIRLPSILNKRTSVNEINDVSRRWPTSIGSGKDSDNGLDKRQERPGLGIPESARRASFV